MRRSLIAGLLAVALAAPASAQLGVPRLVAPLAFSPINVLPMGTRAAGTYVFTSLTVPTGVVGMSALLDVSQQADPLPAFNGTLEGSIDGGTNWTAVGSWTRTAGNKPLTPQGVVMTQLGASWGGGDFWNDSQNANRRLRGGVTLNGSLRFALTVTPL